MSSDRRPIQAVKATIVSKSGNSRYLRWSFRYSTWQVRTRTGDWANVRAPRNNNNAAA